MTKQFTKYQGRREYGPSRSADAIRDGMAYGLSSARRHLTVSPMAHSSGGKIGVEIAV